MRNASKKELSVWALSLVIAGILGGLQVVMTAKAWSRSYSLNAQAEATATARVREVTEVGARSELLFEAAPGDGPQVISPDDPHALHLAMEGPDQAVWDLDYPHAISASLDGGSSESTTAQIYDIETSLASGIGQFPAEGPIVAFFGATLAALPANQEPGTYTGYFPVTVVYP